MYKVIFKLHNLNGFNLRIEFDSIPLPSSHQFYKVKDAVGEKTYQIINLESSVIEYNKNNCKCSMTYMYNLREME